MFEKIAEIITEYVEVPREEITEETSFLSELKMNSLDIMTMVAEPERHLRHNDRDRRP